MTLTESANRGFNLLAISVVGLAGFAFAPEIFIEHDWDDKADDIGLLLLALIGMWWYFTKNNRYLHSITPVILVALSLVAKITAVAIEFSDSEAVGDDFGGLVLFVLAVVLVIYQYRKTKKTLTGLLTVTA